MGAHYWVSGCLGVCIGLYIHTKLLHFCVRVNFSFFLTSSSFSFAVWTGSTYTPEPNPLACLSVILKRCTNRHAHTHRHTDTCVVHLHMEKHPTTAEAPQGWSLHGEVEGWCW